MHPTSLSDKDHSEASPNTTSPDIKWFGDELLWVVVEMGERVSGAIGNLQQKKGTMEEIAKLCEERFIPFAELIRKTGNVNEKDQNLDTALMWAVLGNYTEVVKLLLARPEILVNEKDDKWYTALCWAARYGYTEIVELLLARPEILVNEKNKSEDTSLSLAALKGYTEIIKLLLAHETINLSENNQGIFALQNAKTPEIREMITTKMQEQGIPI